MITTGHEERIFVGSSQISNKLPLSREGDSVKVDFDEASSQQVDIVCFENFEMAAPPAPESVEDVSGK